MFHLYFHYLFSPSYEVVSFAVRFKAQQDVRVISLHFGGIGSAYD